MAMGRFVLGLGRFGLPCGPFWTCQKFVGRFGIDPNQRSSKLFDESVTCNCSLEINPSSISYSTPVQ